MIQREIYTNAPLRLVSLEVKFPLTSRMLTRSLWDALEEALINMLPDVEALMPQAESSVPRDQHDAVLRRISSDRRRAVTVYAGAVTIEVADYSCYEDLRDLTEITLAALCQGQDEMRFTRLGLRYINEVKSSLVNGPDAKWHLPESWIQFINEDLLNGISNVPDSLCAYAHKGTAYFHSVSGDEQATLDYGIHPEGLVESDGILSLGGSPGPCFVLDIDTYFYNIKEESVENTELMRTLSRLHEIADSVFQWAITDHAREILRAPVQDDSDSQLLPASSD